MTINYSFGDAAARGQTVRTAGSNIGGTGGATRCGWVKMAGRPE